MPQLAFIVQHRVDELLDLGIPRFGVTQDFAYTVHWMLYFEDVSFLLPLYNQGGADHLRRGSYVEEEGLAVN